MTALLAKYMGDDASKEVIESIEDELGEESVDDIAEADESYEGE